MTGLQIVFQLLAFNDDLLQQGCSNAHEGSAAHDAGLTSLHRRKCVCEHLCTSLLIPWYDYHDKTGCSWGCEKLL